MFSKALPRLEKRPDPGFLPSAMALYEDGNEPEPGGNIYSWDTKVLFGDIDLYGVVYYLKYFDWCTRVREYFILSLHPDELHRVCPSVLEVVHKFLRPAKLNDHISIELHFTDVKKTSVRMNFDIYRKSPGGRELLGTQGQRVLFLSREGKITKMSPELFATVKQYERVV